MMITTDWHNCYTRDWNGELHPDAYVHPAKVAYGLAERIYQHCIAAGYFKVGDCVLDPFFGVGGFAFHALLNGLNVVGVELESNFVELARKNLDLWRGKYGPGVAVLDDLRARGKLAPYGAATVLRGDSRQLRQVVAGMQGAVSSPPYAQSNQNYANGFKYIKGERDFSKEVFAGNANYGSTPSNLGNLPPGDFASVIGSPPYSSEALGHDAGCIRLDSKEDARRASEGSARRPGYGSTAGQLGSMHAVGSPPFADSLNSDDPDKRGGLFRDEKRSNDRTLTAEYGESAGQLGRMHSVSSPPFEEVQGFHDKKFSDQWGPKQLRTAAPMGYGDAVGNLGNGSGDDFWTAASLIMSEVAAVLPAGAYAVWVVKSFVRDGGIIDFPGQWRQLGESHGFETIETIRAWLVEDKGTQMTLEGGAQQRGTARKSFFRRLYESKHPENAIDYEVVLIQRKRD